MVEYDQVEDLITIYNEKNNIFNWKIYRRLIFSWTIVTVKLLI